MTRPLQVRHRRRALFAPCRLPALLPLTAALCTCLPALAQQAADNGKLQFNWGGRPQDKQQIELARDAEFTQIFARADLQSTEWTLPNPGPGTYYFHYRSIEPDGYVSGWSSTLKVEVKRDWSYIWMLLLPLLGAL